MWPTGVGTLLTLGGSYRVSYHLGNLYQGGCESFICSFELFVPFPEYLSLGPRAETSASKKQCTGREQDARRAEPPSLGNLMNT